MSRTEKRDLPRSIFHRLLNKAKENGDDFNLLLSRYGMDRLGGGLRYKSWSYFSKSGRMRSTSLPTYCRASRRSTSCWASSQNSGELPKSRARRKAITGVRERRSRSNSFTVCRETAIAFASPDADSPNSGRKSSRSIVPGCVGGISLCCVLGILMLKPPLSGSRLFDIIGIVAWSERKANTPLIVLKKREYSLSSDHSQETSCLLKLRAIRNGSTYGALLPYAPFRSLGRQVDGGC